MPERYVTALKEHGHTFKSADNYTTVTAVHRAIDGQIYANSDFRKGSGNFIFTEKKSVKKRALTAKLKFS